jgi:hypothetical protein
VGTEPFWTAMMHRVLGRAPAHARCGCKILNRNFSTKLANFSLITRNQKQQAVNGAYSLTLGQKTDAVRGRLPV